MDSEKPKSPRYEPTSPAYNPESNQSDDHFFNTVDQHLKEKEKKVKRDPVEECKKEIKKQIEESINRKSSKIIVVLGQCEISRRGFYKRRTIKEAVKKLQEELFERSILFTWKKTDIHCRDGKTRYKVKISRKRPRDDDDELEKKRRYIIDVESNSSSDEYEQATLREPKRPKYDRHSRRFDNYRGRG